ncbi:hypothetical protein GCM10007874_14840 [Labrys miyagiensis]|uniref:Uncharacterized protein n=1 Tax=Labrys miyagiensis TaxID=346912 RepID=A0ABQ6CDN4_9HYPH|nr:hypothetical protein GCM10007874_14840 [Labrys miyagiensis]
MRRAARQRSGCAASTLRSWTVSPIQLRILRQRQKPPAYRVKAGGAQPPPRGGGGRMTVWQVKGAVCMTPATYYFWLKQEIDEFTPKLNKNSQHPAWMGACW